ncbi:MAG: phosphatidylserine decarboxylase [Vicinamibacterales bacterium]|nr:phosphatidylserine decarboxylase family protein [Acidobacteriota bacterium]MDP6373233.1 phosphatidylserine decarboxylase [Vicinamibacterales bacterium]MDP6608483.1 phosphatidylserine decarboxylase [Vicinamibacterales bacterium]HAK56346.1 phosphatidylserine decarboxylase family protein [Acidobacteriota bacterium]
MSIDRAGVPFVVGAVLPGAVLVWFGQAWGALAFGVLGAFFVFFFRDPTRHPPDGDGLVLAPADGRVVVAGAVVVPDAPDGNWQQLSIFLSPIDVHVNRAPIGGRITHVERRPGRYLAAYRRAAGAQNARIEVGFDVGGETVVCRQIVGVLARRLVCRVAPGDEVRAGDRFGIMKFGSRIDLFIPRHAELLVEPGQRVRGGETLVARLDNRAPDRSVEER